MARAANIALANFDLVGGVAVVLDDKPGALFINQDGTPRPAAVNPETVSTHGAHVGATINADQTFFRDGAAFKILRDGNVATCGHAIVGTGFVIING